MKFMIRLFLCLFYLVCSQTFAMAKQEDICRLNGIDYSQAQHFFVQLQEALAKNDVRKIIQFIHFPLRVNSVENNKPVIRYIKSPKQFIKAYPEIFNSMMKQYLMTSEVFCNYQGAALGDGSVWFHTDKAQAKIFVINVMDHAHLRSMPNDTVSKD